jgi:hypothetical protein
MKDWSKMQIERLWLAALIATLIAASAVAQNTFPASGNVGIGTTNPQATLDVVGTVKLEGFGYVSSLRSPNNNFTNLFLGGSIFDNGNGSYTVITDGGSNYFAAIGMDNTGGNAGAISFYSAPSTGGVNYTLTTAQLASDRQMTLVAGNLGIGTASPGSKLEVNGNVKLTAGSGASMTFQDGSIQTVAWNGTLAGADYAESVDVTGERAKYEPGDVLVIDSGAERTFQKSAAPYATNVMGVYSTKPGVLGRPTTASEVQLKEQVPMAMVGIVPTKVSAENGPIKPGDMLVTASIPGYAMKGTDRSQMFGAVIGKALGHLDTGTGLIEVAVSLQ